MNKQQPDKSYKKTFNLIEELKERVVYDIEELKDSLNELVEKALEKAGISEAKRLEAYVGLHYNKDANEPFNEYMRPEYNYLTSDIYNRSVYNHLLTYIYYHHYKYDEDENVHILCSLDRTSYKIECLDYDAKTFILSDPLQKCPFLEGIKKSVLNILDDILLDPRELTNMGDQYMNIFADASIDLKKRIRENPKISISRHEFEYRDSIYKISIRWYRYLRPKS
jgi:hypothetical protein